MRISTIIVVFFRVICQQNRLQRTACYSGVSGKQPHIKMSTCRTFIQGRVLVVLLLIKSARTRIFATHVFVMLHACTSLSEVVATFNVHSLNSLAALKMDWHSVLLFIDIARTSLIIIL